MGKEGFIAKAKSPTPLLGWGSLVEVAVVTWVGAQALPVWAAVLLAIAVTFVFNFARNKRAAFREGNERRLEAFSKESGLLRLENATLKDKLATYENARPRIGFYEVRWLAAENGEQLGVLAIRNDGPKGKFRAKYTLEGPCWLAEKSLDPRIGNFGKFIAEWKSHQIADDYQYSIGCLSELSIPKNDEGFIYLTHFVPDRMSDGRHARIYAVKPGNPHGTRIQPLAFSLRPGALDEGSAWCELELSIYSEPELAGGSPWTRRFRIDPDGLHDLSG